MGIPDPSFWAWPEMGIPSHWALFDEPDATLPWAAKADKAFWRGGTSRKFGGKLRKAMINCAVDPATGEWAIRKLDMHDAMNKAAVSVLLVAVKHLLLHGAVLHAM